MGDPKAENWLDPAGKNPETGYLWRVCDMVTELEQRLGRAHSATRVKDWQALWEKLSKGQRGQYTQARGRRPRSRG